MDSKVNSASDKLSQTKDTWADAKPKLSDLVDELMDQDDDYVENERAGSPTCESDYDSDDESEEDDDIPTDRVLRSAYKK